MQMCAEEKETRMLKTREEDGDGASKELTPPNPLLHPFSQPVCTRTGRNAGTCPRATAVSGSTEVTRVAVVTPVVSTTTVR